jgi:hypothetical protein
MPHVAELIYRANRLLDGTDANTRNAALDAVGGSKTVLQAIKRAGLLKQLTPEAKTQANEGLSALPAAVDQALLAVLKSALEREMPLVLQWKPGSSVELQVWEAADGNVGHIGVLLITPYARDLANST